jgi:hypothetical protein
MMSDYYEIVSVVLLAIAACGALWQANVAVKNQERSHERQKKQTTIEYINTLRQEYRSLNFEIISSMGAGRVDKESYEKVCQNREMLGKVRNLLSLFEHLSVGVHADVFDFDIINRMSGRYLCSVFDRWEYYISKRQTRNEHAYEAFQQLVDQIKTTRCTANRNRSCDVNSRSND